MKHAFSSLLCAAVALFAGFTHSPVHAQNHLPMLTVLALDASGSISNNDFDVQKRAAIAYLVLSHELSKAYRGQRPDWVSVSFFGDDALYTGVPFINVNNERDVMNAARLILGYSHPRSGTSIYTAIAKATAEIEQQYNSLPGNYMRNIIVTTDGKDEHSAQRMKQAVRSAFPNPRVNLIMVGVGPHADLREFDGIADLTMSIGNYAELAVALHAVRHMLGNQ